MKHGLLRRYIMRWWNVRQYKNIIGKDETFEQFFLRAYSVPYASWSILDHDKFDAIIRFENLQGDFDAALSKLGMEKVRDIPVANKTAEKTKSFWEYYETDKAKKRAKYIFGPYLKRWGYDFSGKLEQIQNALVLICPLSLPQCDAKNFWIYLR